MQDNVVVNWVFDDPVKMITMSSCPDTKIASNGSFITGRFPVANFFRFWKDRFSLADRPSRYCYNIGTWVQATNWAGYDGNTFGHKNLFELIPPEVLQDARRGNALLVIDNLLEGCVDEKLYGFWHISCNRYDLPPSSILYLSSNEKEPSTYKTWAESNSISDRINVLAFSYWVHCLQYYNHVHLARPLMAWDEHVSHKTKSSAVKDFNCLNGHNRWHREYMMLKLIDAGLHTHGLISHGKIDLQEFHDLGFAQATLDLADSILPLMIDDPGFTRRGYSANELNENFYLNSWLSVVTETHADDDELVLLLSEKVFKPIYAMHPFLVLGDRGTLARLKEMGYKTFDGLLDERYDNECLTDRVEILIKNLKTLRDIKDKAGWFNECRDVCLHNQTTFVNRNFISQKIYLDFMQIYEKLSEIP